MNNVNGNIASNDEARNIEGEYNQSVVTDHVNPNGGKQRVQVVLGDNLNSFIAKRKGGMTWELMDVLAHMVSSNLVTNAFIYGTQLTAAYALPSVSAFLSIAAPFAVLSFILLIAFGSEGNKWRMAGRTFAVILGILGAFL